MRRKPRQRQIEKKRRDKAWFTSYEQYESSWDLEDQSKRCKRSVNCLLVSCRCKRETAAIKPIRNESGDDVITVESNQNPNMLVHVLPDAAAEQGRPAGTRYTDGTVQPVLIPGHSSKDTGRYSSTAAGLSADTTAASSNYTQDKVSQSTRNTRRRNRSWSSLFHMFMFLSITATEGFKDLSKMIPHMYTPNCNRHPQMPIYMMPGKERFPSWEMECNLNRRQSVCNLMEQYVQKARDTNLSGVGLQGKSSILDNLHQGVCNRMERYVHKVRETNLAGVCLQGKCAILEDLHQQPNVRVRCAQQDRYRVKGYDVALKIFEVNESVPRAGYVHRDKPGIID